MRRLAGVLMAGLCLAAPACSSDDDDGASDTVAVAEPALTTDPTTTTVAPTDPPATEPPPTATSTTLSEAGRLAADVEADYREGLRLLNLALMDLSDEAATQAALGHVAGESRQSVEDSVDAFKRDNLRILPEPLADPTVTIEKPAVLVDPTGVAELQACEIDPWIVVETGAGPGGSDAVVDDAIYAYRKTVQLRLEGGIWVVFSSVQTDNWTGLEACPPE